MILSDIARECWAMAANTRYGRLPVERKIVASGFQGKKYGDNPQYILEKVHALDPTIDIVWVKGKNCHYELPEWIRSVEKRDIYYNLDQLPFPCAYDTEQLIANIKNFDFSAYLSDWNRFKTAEVGLFEPGNAAETVAGVIIDYINGNKEALNAI